MNREGVTTYLLGDEKKGEHKKSSKGRWCNAAEKKIEEAEKNTQAHG